MSNGPIVQNSISTIGKAPPPIAAPEVAKVDPAPVEGAAPVAKAEGKEPIEQASVVAPEPEKSPEPDPHLELSKRFGKAAQREANARKLEATYQSKIASLDEKEKKLDAKLLEYEEALADPIAHYMAQNKDPVEIAKRFAKPLSEEARRIQKLEDALKQKDEREKEQETQWKKRQEEQAHFQKMKAFVGQIVPTECPNLTALYEPHEVPRLREELLDRPTALDDGTTVTMLEFFQAKHDRDPTDAEVRECLEYEAELRATKILNSQRAKVAAAQAPPSTSPEAPPAPDSGPRSISNQHAAAVSSSPKKSRLSEEERRKKIRQELSAALEAEGAERVSD